MQRGEYVPGQGAPLFELRPPVLTGWDWALKRAFDLVVGALVLVLGLPVWLLIALAVKLDSRGPVLFVDRRIGVGEREFGMLKFRTMVADAGSLQTQLEAANEAEGALFKIRDDPRVTRVGRFLRRLSLDEVPQIVNVLKGEMSLVGPRPLPLRDYRLLEDWHRARYAVLPGMTGLWQISVAPGSRSTTSCGSTSPTSRTGRSGSTSRSPWEDDPRGRHAPGAALLVRSRRHRSSWRSPPRSTSTTVVHPRPGGSSGRACTRRGSTSS